MRAFGIPEITIMAIQKYSLIGFAYLKSMEKRTPHHSKERVRAGGPISSILFLLAKNHLIEPYPKIIET
jgi:hypothetical protein